MFRISLMLSLFIMLQGCSPQIKSSWIPTVGGYDPSFCNNPQHSLIVHGWYHPKDDLFLFQIAYFLNSHNTYSLYEKRIFILDRQTKLGAKVLITRSNAAQSQRAIHDLIRFIITPENENLPDLGGVVNEAHLDFPSFPVLTWFNFGPAIIPLQTVGWDGDKFNYTSSFYDAPQIIESQSKWNKFLDDVISMNGNDAQRWSDWSDKVGWKKFVNDMGIHRLSPDNPHKIGQPIVSWDTQCRPFGCDSIFRMVQETIVDSEFNTVSRKTLKGKTTISDVTRYMLQLREDDLRAKEVSK